MIDFLLRIAVSNSCISVVLAIAAWAVHRTGKRPLVAHLLWVLVLAKLATPPIVTVPVVPVTGPMAEALAGSFEHEATTAATLVPNADGLSKTYERDGEASLGVAASFVDNVKTGLVLLWLFGSSGILAWSLLRIYRFNRLLSTASEVASPALQCVAEEIGQRLGLKAAPTIYTTSARLSPMVWWLGGQVRILIPAALPRKMDAEQLRWIVAHELAHVRRRDHMVRWLEWLACVCFWWNPVAWWARRNLRISEEICCDALVLSSFERKPKSYAKALMTVVEFLASPVIRPPAIASEFNSGGFLERRFRMIVSDDPTPKTPRWLRTCILLVALTLLPLGVGCYENASAASDPKKPAGKAPSEVDASAVQELNADEAPTVATAVRKLFGKKVADALTETGSGLSYADITVGKGPRSPAPEQKIEFQYRGMFLSGEEFESSYDRKKPPVRKLNSMIPGLLEAFSTMTEGGHRVIVVPPELAYKASGIPGIIPPSSILIYELELLAIK